MSRVAVVDIGSNSTRLLIADVEGAIRNRIEPSTPGAATG